MILDFFEIKLLLIIIKIFVFVTYGETEDGKCAKGERRFVCLYQTASPIDVPSPSFLYYDVSRFLTMGIVVSILRQLHTRSAIIKESLNAIKSCHLFQTFFNWQFSLVSICDSNCS